ncbi:response regulator [Cohnella sp. JJ-181]|uniref:response regulator n=1 Tax=Cohnella rhizoplanae TaxID=2974897 RepID=UPI0022FFAAEB|nr:response regulator [Cohnella sp. JJ-181]CAI6048899.1 HTH-type transcriptional activator RhaR [Cohnella sp. JJ-181]
MYNLLVVDDERLVADTLAETIAWSSAGIGHIHKAYSAMQALQILNMYSIDVVLTDIRMPEMSGLELIEKIRSFNKRTKCIVHTGYADFDYVRQAMSSQVVEYLLKPASDEEVFTAVRRMTEQLTAEWSQITSLQRASATLREHTPLLRAKLMDDLMKGKGFKDENLLYRLDMLQLPFRKGDEVWMIVVRREEDFASLDIESYALFEYAINNIAEETIGEHFDLWIGEDAYDYLVFMVKPSKRKEAQRQALGQQSDAGTQTLLEHMSVQFQENVSKFLQGKISLVLSQKGQFPDDVMNLYQNGVASIRRVVGNDQEIFLSLSGTPQDAPVRSLKVLYEQPTLMQLLDTGKQEPAINKIKAVMEELEGRWKDSHEHLMEVFFSVSAAFLYAAHKNGTRLDELLQEDYEPFVSRKPFLSIKQLRDWALQVTNTFFEDLNRHTKDNKAVIISQIQDYIKSYLAEDVTLQTISKHIHLHPVYLSQIFKSETGENVSNYVTRLKMEKAAYLLKHTTDRIYEISSQVGYMNPPHFIKVFKRTFGVTPQEFRDA